MAEQILKLGLLGAETTLSTISRVFAASGNEETAISGRSADASLHVDFVARKQTFTVTYTTVTEALKDVLTAIYDLQVTNGSFLNFIYTDEADAEIATLVKLSPPNFGALTPKDVFNYGGPTLFMEEV